MTRSQEQCLICLCCARLEHVRALGVTALLLATVMLAAPHDSFTDSALDVPVLYQAGARARPGRHRAAAGAGDAGRKPCITFKTLNPKWFSIPNYA